MQTPLSVSALNAQIKSLLETTFLHVRVQGEVSRPTYHASGHLYFTLKDKDASISCVMFRGNNQRLKFRVEEGMDLVVWGSISVYSPRGSYQINCVGAEPSGSGALALAYEQLKRKLEAKGYFDPSRKRPLPKFPSRVALVTSATGAAIEDMKNVASKRWPMVTLIVIDTIVQGKDAAPSIVKAIQKAHEVDAQAIVVARGGGSVEDLWAFNEEMVAMAIVEASLPVVSAVGHEIDYVISDFVADKRAPTPSAAMEILLPDHNEMRMNVDYLMEAMNQRIKERLSSYQQQLAHLKDALSSHSLDTKIKHKTEEIASLKNAFTRQYIYHLERFSYMHLSTKERLDSAISQILMRKKGVYESLKATFEAKAPQKEHRRGMAQLVKDNQPVDANELQIDDSVQIQSFDVVLEAKIKDKRPI
jgi:exodeoxyribonuclease VII large subunit